MGSPTTIKQGAAHAQLPLHSPLPSLRVFQAVAHKKSFRLAGEALLITQSAVSHHVKILEDFFGVRLFDRHARRVDITPEGAELLAALEAAFATLAGATASIRGRRQSSTLVVSILPSFAGNWLVGRLPRFQQAHPGVDVRLDPTIRTVDVKLGEADVAVRSVRFPARRPDAGCSLWRSCSR
jgi:LysR family glycine cleavage system transcriptional activator